MEVASLCGFKSTPHFSKCYRDRFGVSPRVQRNETDDFSRSDKVHNDNISADKRFVRDEMIDASNRTTLDLQK